MKAWELMAEIAKWPCNAEVLISVPHATGYERIEGVEEVPGGLALVTGPVGLEDPEEDTEDGD